MYVLPAYMYYVQHLHAWYLWKSEEVVKYPVIKDGCVCCVSARTQILVYCKSNMCSLPLNYFSNLNSPGFKLYYRSTKQVSKTMEQRQTHRTEEKGAARNWLTSVGPSEFYKDDRNLH